jgi:hypothetical protein
MKKPVLAIFFVVVVCSAIFAAEPIVVAVPEFLPTGKIPEGDVISITGAITSSLFANSRISKIVDHNQVSRIMKQHKFEAGDWSNPAKVAEIGKALNVNTIAIGTISLIEREGLDKLFGAASRYNISLQLLDINTMEIIGAVSAEWLSSGIFIYGKDPIKNMKIKK